MTFYMLDINLSLFSRLKVSFNLEHRKITKHKTEVEVVQMMRSMKLCCV